MKLWQKISLVCICVLIGIVTVCCTLLLIQSKNGVLNLTVKQAEEKQRTLETSFSQMFSYYGDKNDSPVTEYSLAVYCFSQFADNTSVFIMDGETVYSNINLLPETILPVTGHEQQTYLGETDGRHILIVGSSTVANDKEAMIYVVEDVSSIYNDITRMAWRFIAICATGTLAGAVLIILLVRKATKPLHVLSETTKRISGGEYARRAEIASHDEIGSLAADFNAMADAVETHIAELTETAERQRLFIGGVTHELKTPLATMLIHSDTLLNANVDRRQVEISLKHINNQCRWLEHMTQKLLRLITLKEDIKLCETDVSGLFDDVAQSVAGIMKERMTPLKIECETDALMVDADLMRSALINLVDNASKASDAGQAVILRAYGRTIEVCDSGKGIPENEIARVTEPFYMIDPSRNKKKGGSGLGLALVCEIVRAHGAALSIESEVGRGTVVKIEFPENNLKAT